MLQKQQEISLEIKQLITSAGKTKNKEEEETFIPPKKGQQIIDDVRLFQTK